VNAPLTQTQGYVSHRDKDRQPVSHTHTHTHFLWYHPEDKHDFSWRPFSYPTGWDVFPESIVSQISLQVLLLSSVQRVGVSRNHILYRLITCKVRYFKPLFVIIDVNGLKLMRTFSQYSNFEFRGFISVIHNHQNYNKQRFEISHSGADFYF